MPGENAGFSNAPEEKLYSRVILDEPYGPARVNARDEQKDPESLHGSRASWFRHDGIAAAETVFHQSG